MLYMKNVVNKKVKNICMKLICVSWMGLELFRNERAFSYSRVNAPETNAQINMRRSESLRACESVPCITVFSPPLEMKMTSPIFSHSPPPSLPLIRYAWLMQPEGELQNRKRCMVIQRTWFCQTTSPGICLTVLFSLC